MVNSTTLATHLASFAGIGVVKTANGMTPRDDQPVATEKLQALVGLPGEQRSTYSQHTPEIGHNMLANPLSPLQGDEIFFSGLTPGARFQSHDGQVWEIESYDWEGAIGVFNVMYPRRERGIVSIQDLRKSIYAWTEPFSQIVPPIPIGVDYGVVETKSVA